MYTLAYWERNGPNNEPVMRVSNDNGATFAPALKLAAKRYYWYYWMTKDSQNTLIAASKFQMARHADKSTKHGDK